MLRRLGRDDLSEGWARYLDEDAGSLDSAGRAARPLGGRACPRSGSGSRPGRGRAVPRRVLPADGGPAAGHRCVRSARRRRPPSGTAAAGAAGEPLGPSPGFDRPGRRRALRLDDLSEDDQQATTALFTDRLLPALAPLVADPGRPLPAAANLSINVAVAVRTGDGRRRFGSVEPPPVLPRFLRLARPPWGADGAVFSTGGDRHSGSRAPR